MSITKLGENQKLMKDGVIEFPENGKPYLVGSKCKKCGKEYFPARPICLECFSEEMEIIPLSQEGSIYAMTNVYVGIKGFKAPYMLGWIDVGQNRIAAQIDWDPENPIRSR
jgi:benzoylsuccinyl-CoA thiolase BbsA subunit